MTEPRFTIVTPSFNQRPFLERTITSVLDQSFTDFEYFVFDGGSTDGSRDVLEHYGDRLDYWVSQKDGGQAAAINSGWRRGRGHIVAWINSDDFLLPGALRLVSDFFVEHPDVDMLYGKCVVVDPEGAVLGTLGERFRLRRMLYGRQPMPQPSTFLRRRLVETTGYLDETLHLSMDYDLFLRCALRTDPYFVDHELSAFRVHDDAKTTRARARSRAETFDVALRYAKGVDRLAVRLFRQRARLFHALPRPIKSLVDRLRTT